MTLNTLLARVDEQTMQELLGRDALRLIQALNKQEDIVTKLKDVLLELYSPEGLLLLKDKRSLLLDLLRPAEVEKLCRIIKLRYDGSVYKRLKKLNFKRGSDKEMALFNFFGLFPPTLEEEFIVPEMEKIFSSYPLFKHQRVAASKVDEALSSDPRRVLLHMPTGAGKTRTAMHVVARHLANKNNVVVVWLAYSEELCEQAAGEFSKAWNTLGNRELPLYRFWGRYDIDFDNTKDGFVVVGLSKLYNTIKKRIATIRGLASKTSLVVIDEAHQAIAESYRLVLDALFYYKDDTRLLGLTATPGRTAWDRISDAELSDFFNRKKVTLDVEGYSNPIEYLVKENYIAKTEYKILTYKGTENWSDVIKEAKFDIPDYVLSKLAEDELRNLKIISTIEKLTKKHKRILVFAISVKHAEMLAAVLRARGFSASSVVADTACTIRKRLIDDFKNKEDGVKILTNYGVLTTGFDAPQTSAAVIARPTKSLVLFSQMVGRATRGLKAGGNKKAEIVTVVDMSLPGFGGMVEAFNNWEDVWS